MNEVVIAVYNSARSAQAAVDDLSIARVPSATVRQYVDTASGPGGLMELRNGSAASGDRIVSVTVEGRHAGTVADILGMRAPVSMTEAPLSV